MDPRIKPIPLYSWRWRIASLASPSNLAPRGLARVLTLTFVGSALLLVLLSGCGGGGGGTAAPTEVQPPPPAGTLSASKPGELLAYARAKLAERQAQRELAASDYVSFVGIASDPVPAAPGTSTPSLGSVTASTAIDRSGTTVQETGVDEDDVLKSDGSLILTLAREAQLKPGGAAARVAVYRRQTNGSPELAGATTLNSDAEATSIYTGMYLAATAGRAVALGGSPNFGPVDFCPGTVPCPTLAFAPVPIVSKPKVVLDVLGLPGNAAPVLRDKLRIDGNLVGSRLIGNTLILVTQHAPKLAVDALPWNAPKADREALLARLTAQDLLPQITVNGGPASALVAETDCYVEPKNASFGLDITTITTIDLASDTLARRSRCFIGGSEALYMSSTALYLATSRYTVTPAANSARTVFPQQISTDIHKFALNTGAVDYRGSGNVNGHLGWDSQSRSYRFSEFNGDLRVLTFTGQTGWGALSDATNPAAPAPSPATLTVLRERSGDKSLQTVATLPNAQRPATLGKPGEQVYAVRFVGDRGYVVTFRRIDPLYVLDLSNPTDPKAVGELQAAGFSNYLFPAGNGLLLGVGRDADERGAVTGVKVALFDVADPARPTQRASYTLGDQSSVSSLEYSRHGIDLFARGNQVRVLLPVTSYNFSKEGQPFALQRFEVDAGARTLVQKAPLAASVLDPSKGLDMGLQRTLQIGDQVYFFNGNTLSLYGW